MRTAAPSPAVATGRTIRRRSAPRRRRGARLTARATILLAVLAGILFLSVAPARMYVEQRAELAELEREAAALASRNERLTDRAERLRDAAFLERLARQCLGMVRPGEVAFVVVPKEGAPAPPPEC
jgi:cell division protein FtsB